MSAFAASVIPAKAGIHEHGRPKIGRGGVHGSRVKPGMTHQRLRPLSNDEDGLA
jgi:hypothetical protein